jgi:hypothetical protein
MNNNTKPLAIVAVAAIAAMLVATSLVKPTTHSPVKRNTKRSRQSHRPMHVVMGNYHCSW